MQRKKVTCRYRAYVTREKEKEENKGLTCKVAEKWIKKRPSLFSLQGNNKTNELGIGRKTRMRIALTREQKEKREGIEM